MDREVRLCMIGAGGHSSRNIYPYFRFLKNARVVANADLDEGKARRQAELSGIPTWYADYRQMLEAERPDGVMVCVGREFHAEASAEILQMGFHVYTEKPNAATLEQSRRALAVQKETGRICMVGYKKRFAPSYRRAKEIVEGEWFGKPSLIALLRTKGHDRKKDDPKREYLLDWGCHAIDLVHFFFGPVARVHTFTAHSSTNSYAIGLSFASGAVGSICFTDRAGLPITEELTAAGTGGVRVEVDRSLDMVAYKDQQPFEIHRPEFASGSFQGGVEQGFVGELQEFVDAIAEGRQPESSIAQATHTMAIYEAIQRSAGTGEVVEVEATEEVS
jgi:predicted dehydrogenase